MYWQDCTDGNTSSHPLFLVWEQLLKAAMHFAVGEIVKEQGMFSLSLSPPPIYSPMPTATLSGVYYICWPRKHIRPSWLDRRLTAETDSITYSRRFISVLTDLVVRQCGTWKCTQHQLILPTSPLLHPPKTGSIKHAHQLLLVVLLSFVSFFLHFFYFLPALSHIN